MWWARCVGWGLRLLAQMAGFWIRIVFSCTVLLALDSTVHILLAGLFLLLLLVLAALEVGKSLDQIREWTSTALRPTGNFSSSHCVDEWCEIRKRCLVGSNGWDGELPINVLFPAVAVGR